MRYRLRNAWLAIAAGLLLVISLRALGFSAILPRCMFHGLPAALIVAGVVFGPLDRDRGRLMRVLEIGGDASYALYLFHPFALRAATIVWHVVHGPPRPYLLLAVITVLTVAMSVAINLAIEKPIDHWLRRIVRRRDAPLTAVDQSNRSSATGADQ